MHVLHSAKWQLARCSFFARDVQYLHAALVLQTEVRLSVIYQCSRMLHTCPHSAAVKVSPHTCWSNTVDSDTVFLFFLPSCGQRDL